MGERKNEKREREEEGEARRRMRRGGGGGENIAIKTQLGHKLFELEMLGEDALTAQKKTIGKRDKREHSAGMLCVRERKRREAAARGRE